MPPAIANQIHGDTAFLAADDPVKNGYGSVSVASNLELRPLPRLPSISAPLPRISTCRQPRV